MASIQARAQSALAKALAATLPVDALDGDARTQLLEHNLINGITDDQRDAVVAQLSRGDGGELLERKGRRPKLHSAYSSAALAANAFAAWIGRENELDLGNVRGFETLEFERKCSVGVRGKTPNLDVLGVSSDRIVAVESKCTEHLARHVARFSDVYDARVTEMAHPSWREEFIALKADPRRYTFLDAAQLVKHYLGLRNSFPDRPCTLLYLYWEPTNAGANHEFIRHREEVDHFRATLDDPSTRFVAESYSDLWNRWKARTEPAWLAGHVAGLQTRYRLAI